MQYRKKKTLSLLLNINTFERHRRHCTNTNLAAVSQSGNAIYLPLQNYDSRGKRARRGALAVCRTMSEQENNRGLIRFLRLIMEGGKSEVEFQANLCKSKNIPPDMTRR